VRIRPGPACRIQPGCLDQLLGLAPIWAVHLPQGSQKPRKCRNPISPLVSYTPWRSLGGIPCSATAKRRDVDPIAPRRQGPDWFSCEQSQAPHMQNEDDWFASIYLAWLSGLFLHACAPFHLTQSGRFASERRISPHHWRQSERPILHPASQAQHLEQATKLGQLAFNGPGQTKSGQPIRPQSTPGTCPQGSNSYTARDTRVRSGTLPFLFYLLHGTGTKTMQTCRSTRKLGGLWRWSPRQSSRSPPLTVTSCSWPRGHHLLFLCVPGSCTVLNFAKASDFTIKLM